MPHSTSSGTFVRDPSVSRSNAKTYDDQNGDGDAGLEKFPDHIDAPTMRSNSARSISPGILPKPNGYAIGLNGGMHLNADRWQPRRDNSMKTLKWENGTGPRGHRHKKSISEAFHNIRDRRASVSQNAHEIADALRAPISPKLIVCRLFASLPRTPTC